MIFVSAPEPYVVKVGREACDHVGSQILRHSSPYGSHMIWTCPHCHRIVRHDTPVVGSRWTDVEVVMPVGLEGVEFGDARVWKMPDVDRVKPKRRWKR